MEPNVGSLDRMVRICIALLFVAGAYFYNVWWLYVLALAPLATAVFEYCPAYAPFNISTAEKKTESKAEEKEHREGVAKKKNGKKKG